LGGQKEDYKQPKSQERRCQAFPFFEDEIHNLEKELQSIDSRVKQLPFDKNNAARQIETIQKQMGA